MQQNLDKILKLKFKPTKVDDSLQKHGEIPRTSKNTSSNLLRILSSHTRSKRTAEATNLPIADGTWKRGRASGGDGIIPTDKNLEMPANNAIDGKFTITEREKGRRCPLCGKIFAVASGEYDDHFHAELVAVAENDLDTWETNERAAECDALEANIDCIDDDDDAPRVYILGGRPSTAVPKDPKKFRPSAFKLGKKKAPPTLPAANHYADGGGLLGGEELGIDGHNLAGLKWEGMGASFNV